ncbi:AAA family ATPase [Paenibacillus montanisoli]|uniref:DNA topology modulation protein FlaR n=1 Tax=Paenibacillus montanisoli TaxID=2081970 RepID=A0A328U4V5_9BACL|nr:hypothetical protein [Paenibacillus montanisoli]RAP75054.1 hypothetical protein DL346_16820 [Paenibacillus montanisoli]
MKKIFIVGIVASGKTTLAKRLSERINVPWHELDCIVHHRTASERFKRTAAEQVEVIKEIDRNGPWILEGTDRESYRQCLFELADTIIFLDTPLWKRRIRILTRFAKQKLGMETCHYKPDLNMLRMMYKWTRDFERNRDRMEAELQRYPHKVIRLADSDCLEFVDKAGVRR